MPDAVVPRSARVECVVGDPEGMHARPCMRVARTAGRFRCDVRVQWNDRSGDAKSVLELLRLSAPRGARLTFVAAGADAARCLEAVAAAMADVPE